MASEGGSALPGRDPAWKYCLPIEEDDDDEDVENEDVSMYPTDMHPDERDAYRSAVRASKASEWEREQYDNIVEANAKRGSLHSLLDYPKQKNIKDTFKGGAIKETMGRLISKFFIYESVAPVKAKSHHFKNMIIGAQQAGMGIEPPSPFDIKNKYLEMEYRDMEAYVNQQREKWKTYGCTIMSDGWTGPTKLSIINFMVILKGAWSSLNNGSAFMKAGKQLMKKYNLYWTPCAAHCIDLILKTLVKDPVLSRSWRLDVQNNTRSLGETLKHPLHAAAYFLNPRFQYRRGVGSDPELLQAVHDVFAKLDPTTESLGQFGNEMQKRIRDRATIAARSTMVPAEWWFMYGNQTPTLRKLAIKVLSQTASSTACERNWSTLKLRDMEAENDRVAEKDYLDLLDISAEVGEEEDNQLFQWKFTLKVLAKILMIPTRDDSTSAGHSSRPSAAGTSASGYDGSRGGTDDGGDNAGGDINERQHSQYPVSQFTCENTFTHCTQDEDHGSRRAGPGIGAIGKPYRGRERMMEPYNEELLSGSFESMSIGTQFSDSSNETNVYPPHVMSYGQPSSSTDEEYGMSRYSPSRQMSYQVPYQME
ncbi:hypothetical protein CK203_052028 [Vitis vinifera]|uniref:HAT C-terminal dimerisation domain-containing protein n=1 Tax=Vitis vinifera TaxID=29760 RepID=A0A438GR31_VITVI|nr:hypothetical protein CK203_052028 [Vitis vinifera]